MNKITPFRTNLYTDRDDNRYPSIIEEILEMSLKNQSRMISNYGGWQSDEFWGWDVPLFLMPIATKIIQCASIVAKDYGFDQIKIDNFWINVNRKHNYNRPHNHPNSMFSAVYYLTAPKNCGKIVFERPDVFEYHIPTSGENEERYGEYSVVPEDGTIIVFPSYVRHYVEPNETNSERISLAFNLK